MSAPKSKDERRREALDEYYRATQPAQDVFDRATQPATEELVRKLRAIEEEP